MKNIIIKDKKQYLIVLKKLFDKCDSFKIVVPLNKNFLNLNNNSVPLIIQKLLPYSTNSENTNTWPGTKISRGQKKNYRVYTFKICPQTFDIMKKYSNFFDLKVEDKIEYYISFDEEMQLDISFFEDNNCIFYTTVHEGIYMIEKELS